MNPTKEENGDLCEMAMFCCSRGSSSLSNFPGLMKQIIETRAWECREFRGKVYQLPSLADLITRPSLEGWGESLDKVEKLLEDDQEVLLMWQNEVVDNHGGDRKSEQVKIKADNISLDKKPTHGTNKAYGLQRLEREAPDKLARVQAGELSVNAAMIAAGLRKEQVTVTSDPDKAAKTLRKKFGDDYIKELIKVLQKELT